MWYPLLAPAGTPQPIVDRLNAQLVAILGSAEVQERLVGQGVEPIGSTPVQLASHLKSELAKWAKVVKLSGVSVD